jgi:hypothetical protein
MKGCISTPVIRTFFRVLRPSGRQSIHTFPSGSYKRCLDPIGLGLQQRVQRILSSGAVEEP